MNDQQKDALKLENQLCFALYACAKEIVRRYKPFLEPYGLTYTQYIALLVLWEKDALTVSELGTLLELDSGTLTPLLKKMERSGLLERRRCVEDERSVRIYLTEKGHTLQEQFADLPQKIFCQTGLSLQEAMVLKSALSSFHTSLVESNHL